MILGFTDIVDTQNTLLCFNAVILRSEPSSRKALTGEQPDPWELLHPQDALSRHRCRILSLPKVLTIPSSS